PQMLPVVLLLLLLLGCWRAVAIWAGLLAALGVAAMPVLGAAWPLRYLRFVVDSARLGEDAYINPANMPTWRGLVTNLVGGWAPALVTPLFAGLALASLGVLLWSWWRSRAAASPGDGATTPSAPRVDLLWALACVVALLISFHLGP